MKVTVKPIRPIPGILPKNKWIDTEMELDLNKNEIIHCMKFGNVYDEDGKLIDSLSIKKMSFVQKPVQKNVVELIPVKEDIVPVPVEEPTKEEIVEEVVETPVIEEPVVEEVVEETTVDIVEEEIVEEVIESYFDLKSSSASKDGEYIILETMMDTNSKLEGNLYGLFTITSGARPVSIEYLLDGNWVKFSNKFANFNIIENGDKFVFRFIPRGENEFSYRLLIKSANDILAKLEGAVNPLVL